MVQYVMSMERVSKTYPPNHTVLQDVTLAFLPQAKIGVIGVNGAGKSTLLRMLGQVDTHFSGEIRYGAGVKVGYLAQEPQLDASLNVRENLLAGLGELSAWLREFHELSEKMGTETDDLDALLTRQGELQEQIESVNGWDVDSQLEMAAEALRCPDLDSRVDHLSGGERRRVALCKLLLARPEVLLLDEPTNHLDAETVAWLERHLRQYPGCVIMITHDRYFLDNITGWILELDRGRAYPFEGNYSQWLEQKEKRLATQDAHDQARRRVLQREREWVSQSPKARQAKAKARINAYHELLNQAQTQQAGTAQIMIPPGPRLGDKVIDVAELSKAYDDKLLFDNLTFALPAGGIVGVIGGNGAGKTTLFRILIGQEQADSGAVSVGSSVAMGYVDQERDALAADKTVFEEIADGKDTIDMGAFALQSRAYVAGFNFRGPDQQRKVAQLSGGERNRVHMAKLLKQPANVLLLDEPTNDLDVETLRELEDALTRFAGSAVIISHDRWFLDRIATHILAFEGDSQVVWFDGNYAAYEADRQRRLGTAAQQPARVKHRKLTR